MGLEARNIFSGERIINKAYYNTQYALGYGNGKFPDIATNLEYFPIVDNDGNFISQLPVMTTGYHNAVANWHWAKWPQNNIIYHPCQTNNGLHGQLLNIGGKRFIAHGMTANGYDSSLYSATARVDAMVIWMYIPLDN